MPPLTPTKSHADQRRTMRWIDQHGRPWVGEMELKTGDPCGLPPQPAGWTPADHRLLPPPHFRLYNRVENEPTAMRINYEGWVTDLKEKHATYTRLFHDVGHEFHGSEFDPARPSVKVQREMGQRPLAIELVYAMRQGNRSALGWDERTKMAYAGAMDPRLVEFMPKADLPVEPDFRDDLDFSNDHSADADTKNGSKRGKVAA